MLWNSISKVLKWSKVYGQINVFLRNISQGSPRAPEKLKVDNFGNSENQENPFSEKILHRVKEVKKADPPKTTQKTDLIA